MSKVLLVEDDNNLREIFQMRLQAEGYQTVTAADGEEGLVVAMKEKPDLIIADIMMPKLSGFEMVENLRNNPDTKDIRVIMMTALGQAEDQARGEKLNVVEYLVKSQVTLEDFARVVKDALGPGGPQAAPSTPQITTTSNNTQGSEGPMQDDTTPTNPSAMPGDAGQPAAPATPPADSGIPTAPGQQSSAEEQSSVQSQVDQFAAAPAAPAGDTSAAMPGEPTADTSAPSMPPASEPPAAPTEPPATTGPGMPGGDQPANPPTDPTANAL